MGIKMPGVSNSDGIQDRLQTSFGGINHRLGAADGELWWMKNLCSNHAPVMSTRPKRVKVDTLEEPYGLFSWNALAWVDGDKFYYDGEEVGTCTRGAKQFCGIGAYIIIMPDKLYYNTLTEEYGSIESKWSGDGLTFTNGKLYDEDATANCIKRTGTVWSDYFREGDAVTISGCTQHPENNKTPIIRQIDGDKIYFYENIFKLDGDEGTTEYTETGTLKVERLMPDMDFVIENENRLWGCGGNEIYSSKLGDIFNWNVFDGLTTDSYAVAVGSAGAFEGAVSYIDYPTFFKGDRIYKMYGYYPSNYQLMSTATLGMDATGEQSCAVAGDKLYYLGATGFCAYSGGVPSSIHDPLGDVRYRNAVAGTDGRKYYVSAQNEDDEWDLLVFDTQTSLWHREDETHVLSFARLNGDTYMLTAEGEIWKIGSVRDDTGTEEDDFDWECEFADATFGSPDTKELYKLQIRMELDPGAWAEIYIRYDGRGRWTRINMDRAEKKKSVFLPVTPARCDHYRLKIKGHGGCKVWSINRQFSLGSEWRHYYK